MAIIQKRIVFIAYVDETDAIEIPPQTQPLASDHFNTTWTIHSSSDHQGAWDLQAGTSSLVNRRLGLFPGQIPASAWKNGDSLSLVIERNGGLLETVTIVLRALRAKNFVCIRGGTGEPIRMGEVPAQRFPAVAGPGGAVQSPIINDGVDVPGYEHFTWNADTFSLGGATESGLPAIDPTGNGGVLDVTPNVIGDWNSDMTFNLRVGIVGDGTAYGSLYPSLEVTFPATVALVDMGTSPEYVLFGDSTSTFVQTEPLVSAITDFEGAGADANAVELDSTLACTGTTLLADDTRDLWLQLSNRPLARVNGASIKIRSVPDASPWHGGDPSSNVLEMSAEFGHARLAVGGALAGELWTFTNFDALVTGTDLGLPTPINGSGDHLVLNSAGVPAVGSTANFSVDVSLNGSASPSTVVQVNMEIISLPNGGHLLSPGALSSVETLSPYNAVHTVSSTGGGVVDVAVTGEPGWVSVDSSIDNQITLSGTAGAVGISNVTITMTERVDGFAISQSQITLPLEVTMAPVVATPVALAVLVDRSTSMNGTRWPAAISGAQWMSTLVQVENAVNDIHSMAVLWFGGWSQATGDLHYDSTQPVDMRDVDQGNSPNFGYLQASAAFTFDWNMLNDGDLPGKFSAAASYHAPAYATALGSGLLYARDELNKRPPAEQRAIVCLSDGNENCDPETGHIWGSLTPAQPWPETNITIDCLAVSPIALPPLQTASSNTGGTTSSANAIDISTAVSVPMWFLTTFKTRFGWESLDTLDPELSTNASHNNPVLVDSSHQKFAYTVFTQDQGSNWELAIKPPGGTFISAPEAGVEFIEGPTYSMIVVTRSGAGAGQFPNNGIGEWTAKVTRTGAGTGVYTAAAIGRPKKGPRLSFWPYLHPKAKLKLGEVIPLLADLKLDGNPYSKAKVTATVTRPKIWVQALIAKRMAKLAHRNPSDGKDSLIQEVTDKLLAELGDKAFTTTEFSLSPNQAARYAGRLRLEHPGHHRITVTVQTKGMKRSKTINVDIPFPVDARSTKAQGYITKKALRLSVVPQSTEGQLLGPSFAGRVHFVAPGGRHRFQAEDQGDGTYSIALPVSMFGKVTASKGRNWLWAPYLALGRKGNVKEILSGGLNLDGWVAEVMGVSVPLKLDRGVKTELQSKTWYANRLSALGKLGGDIPTPGGKNPLEGLKEKLDAWLRSPYPSSRGERTRALVGLVQLQRELDDHAQKETDPTLLRALRGMARATSAVEARLLDASTDTVLEETAALHSELAGVLKRLNFVDEKNGWCKLHLGKQLVSEIIYVLRRSNVETLSPLAYGPGQALKVPKDDQVCFINNPEFDSEDELAQLAQKIPEDQFVLAKDSRKARLVTIYPGKAGVESVEIDVESEEI